MSALEAPRANRDGDPCPPWCVTDHDELLIPGQPVFGYLANHVSDPMTGELHPMAVKVCRYPDGTAVEIDRHVTILKLSAQQAGNLADVLEWLPGLLGTSQLIDELRVAAAIALEAEGGAR